MSKKKGCKFILSLSKGFTLTELLVTVSVISLISIVVFANYKTGNQQFALQRSAHKMAQDIRRAQEMAMSAKECAVCGNVVPPGYGIYSGVVNEEPEEYFLFADIDGDGRYSDTELVETISYEEGVFLSSVNAVCLGSPSPGLRRYHLAFHSPDPSTELWVGWAPSFFSCSEITFNLRSSVSGQTVSVTVNQIGLIEVQ